MIHFSASGWNRTARVICAFSVVAMLVGAGIAVQRMSYLGEARVTQATIAKMVESRSQDGAPQYTALYVFTDADGNEIKVVSASADRPPASKVGDQIELLDLAAAPHQAIHNHFFGKWGPALITSGLGMLYFLVFGIIARVTGRRLRNPDLGNPLAA